MVMQLIQLRMFYFASSSQHVDITAQHDTKLDYILISGPTASGKTALSLELADRLGGTVINADSMQVYRDLPILSAQPSPSELLCAPHRMFGHVDARDNYSVGRWLADIGEELEKARADHHIPIIVGGTGLYFKALIEGLSEMPVVPAEVRAHVRAKAESQSTPELHAELAQVDITSAARIRPSDRLRTLRALEVHAATGRSINSYYAERTPSLLGNRRGRRLFLNRPRADLVQRIETRFGTMMDSGALDEVAALGRRGLDPALPAMRAHGVPWLLRHLDGVIDRKTAVEGAIMDTRRYAKRQLTWFRGQMSGWDWIDPARASQIAVDLAALN
jgi:tRNA dimethylallyltransferase